jgi:hypothetical protein
MNMAGRITLMLALAAPAVAHADHHGMAMSQAGDTPSTFGAGVSLLAATFATTYYSGDYEGLLPSASWATGRFAAGASLPAYRVLENGLAIYGVGDLVVNGQAALLVDRDVQAGVMLAASAPTGNEVNGLGMGHYMVMPAAWGAWHLERVVLTGSFGYSRAIVHASAQHDHGMWPLVEPMNMSELTWSGAGEVAIGEGVRAGGRLSGGVPVGVLPGHERVVAAARVAWAHGSVDSAAELQAGVAGDPFTLRAVVSTAVRF